MGARPVSAKDLWPVSRPHEDDLLAADESLGRPATSGTAPFTSGSNIMKNSVRIAVCTGSLTILAASAFGCGDDGQGSGGESAESVGSTSSGADTTASSTSAATVASSTTSTGGSIGACEPADGMPIPPTCGVFVK